MGRSLACVLGLILAIPANAADEPRPPAGAASPAGRTLDFRVVESNGGKPVVGAAILARSTRWDEKSGRWDVGTTNPGTTDAQGYCGVPVPPDHRTLREFAVYAARDGFVPIKVLWGYNREFEFEGVPASWTVALDRGTTIGGVVRDEQGRPVAGARVYPWINGERRDEVEWIEWPPGMCVMTDPQGRWQCATWPASYDSEIAHFHVEHPDFILRRPGDPALPIQELHVQDLRAGTAVAVLKTGFALEGSVADPQGRPIEGADVTMYADSPYPGYQIAQAAAKPGPWRGPEGIRVKTGRDGRFRFEKLADGMAMIAAEAPGLATGVKRVQIGPMSGPQRPVPSPPDPPVGGPVPQLPAGLIERPPGQVFRVDAVQSRKDGPSEPPLAFRLAPGRTIAGRVVDGKGRPVAGAVVVPEYNLCVDQLGWRGRTDADGRFRWTNAPTEALSLHVGTPAGGEVVRHEVGPGAAGEVVIATRTPFRLSGQVIDAETGRPIERFRLIKASVYLRGSFLFDSNPEEDGPPDWSHEPAETFAGGRYETRFVDAADTPLGYPLLRIRVEAEGYAPAVSRRYQDHEGEQTCDFALRKRPWIKGTVRAPDGSPTAGAEVVVAVKGQPVPWIDNGRLASGWTGDVVRTGPDGRYAFAKPDAAGRVVIVADRGLAQRTIDELAAEPDVTLEPWGRIRGQVRVGTGVGARRLVSAVDAESDHRGKPMVSFFGRTLTDAEGRFVLDRVAPGYAVVYRPHWPASGRAQRSHRQGVNVASGQTAEVILGGAGRPVVGRLTRTAGLPAFDLEEVRGRLWLLQPSPEFPEGFDEWDETRRNEWWFAFYRTEEGRRYYERGGAYAVNVRPDGSFRLDDVPEGNYRLAFEYETHPNAMSGDDPQEGPTRVAELRLDLDVPAGPDETPMDLGTLTLTAPERGVVDR